MTLRRASFVPVPPGGKPGFDHADVFSGTAGTRMYVAHTGADRVDVFDCASARYLRALSGHPGVAGVFVDSERDLLLTTDRGAARLSVYRVSDERLLGRISVGPHPNGVALDTGYMRAYTFDLGEPLGVGCTATIVDLEKRSVMDHIPLPGRPRWACYDAATRSIYANIADPALIVVIDTEAMRISRTMDVPSAGPHGLAVIGARLFCAADGAELVVLDLTGTVQARLPLAGVPDVLMHDRELGRLYVAIGAPGLVQSFDTRALRPLETIETEEGAHTIGWEPARKQLWVFGPRSCGATVYQDAA